MTEKKYLEIRRVAKDFVHKILEWDKSSRQAMIYAGKKLDFWDGQTMVFDTEEESDVLMDFLIYERRKDGSKLIELFYNSDQEVDESEDEVLEGMVNSYSSIFEINSINPESNTIRLTDLFDKDQKQYELMDLGLSQTTTSGLILYTRLIPIRKLFMTSGVSFGFDSSVKNRLLNQIALQRFKRRGQFNSTDLFVIALKKSKQFGIDIVTLETE